MSESACQPFTMTTAERSIVEHLQHPNPNDSFYDCFSCTVSEDLRQLYEVVWTQRHLPIRRAKVVRPTGIERVQEVHTPEECWVVETEVFCGLNAPTTIMIRQEFVQCIGDLIRTYSREQTRLVTGADSNDGEENAGQTLEKLSFDAFHGLGGSDTMSVDSDESHKASLPTSASFPNPFEHDLLRKPKIGNCTAVLVSGQPGIGKSVQLLLILILRLHAHLPTIWQDADNEATLFTQDGIFTILLPTSLSAMPQVGKYIPPCSWVLFDTNINTKSWPQLTYATRLFAVQTSEPNRDLFSWRSKANVRMWYMKPFTLPEILAANHWQRAPWKESKLKEYMEKYAPSALMAYMLAGELNDHERMVRNSINRTSHETLQQLVRNASMLDMGDLINHHIVRFDPGEFRDEDQVGLASRFVWDLINEFAVQGDPQKLRDWYSLFLRTSSRETVGWVLDSAFHDALFRKRQWLVLELEQKVEQKDWYWTSNPSATGQFMMFDPGQDAVHLPMTGPPVLPAPGVPVEHYDMDTRLILRPHMCYYRPSQRTQAKTTFDSFLWTGKRHKLAVVFQATVYENYRIRKRGLNWLLSLDDVEEVWYVAVTPEDVSVHFPLDMGVQEQSKITRRLHIKMGPRDLV